MESPAKKSSVRDKDTRHSIESISQSAESIPRGGGGGIDDNVVVDYKKNYNGNSNNVNDETISDLLSSGEARPFYLAALTFQNVDFFKIPPHASRYREYPNLIEIYVPEKSALPRSRASELNLNNPAATAAAALNTQKQPVIKRKGGQVIDVPKPPVPFSLAQMDNVRFYSGKLTRLVCAQSY